MSRHHMLPPIIYLPPPRPRKMERRRGRIQVRSGGEIGDTSEVDEAEEKTGLGASALNKPSLQLQIPIEGSERKPQSTTGFLSETTLTALLAAQELAK